MKAKTVRQQLDADLMVMAADELEAAPGPRPVVIQTRITDSARTELERIAAREGPEVNLADLLRRAIVLYLRTYAREARTTARAETIAEQARALFAQLPEDELGEDEPIAFRMAGGQLIVKAQRTGAEYHQFDGAVVRLNRNAGDEGELVVFSEGKAIERRAIDLSGTAEDGTPRHEEKAAPGGRVQD